MGDGVSGAVVGSNPRGRGDDYELDTKKPHPREQPPRARGRHLDHGDHVRGGRATPAGAGTTATNLSAPWPDGSNPRGRGDDDLAALPTMVLSEQPPRARGRLRVRTQWAVLGGATPAGAGTTRGGRRLRRSCGSNPRGRGDDAAPWRTASPHAEQPPRARGRQADGEAAQDVTRATPAGAGTTDLGKLVYLALGSNPRGRGDDLVITSLLSYPGEQPPRARGRRLPGSARPDQGGATPAGAGTTRAWRGRCTWTRSNPRGRGDDSACRRCRAR